MSSGNEAPHDDLTKLLALWTKGDKEALRLLVPLVYAELRRVAHNRLRRERRNHSLQTTALVHEAYVRLVRHPPRAMSNRTHFFALAAGVMRQVLVDHARDKGAQKRYGGVKLELRPEMMPVAGRDIELLTLDSALTKLAKLDPRQGRILELRVFAGLWIEETREVIVDYSAT